MVIQLLEAGFEKVEGLEEDAGGEAERGRRRALPMVG